MSPKDTGCFLPAELYYGRKSQFSLDRHLGARRNSLPFVLEPSEISVSDRPRRLSNEESATCPRTFLVHVKTAKAELLSSEDTDGNGQITIEDQGIKNFAVSTLESGGLNHSLIQGNYRLGTLLQELTLAEDFGPSIVTIDELRLVENPLHRLSRFINDSFWDRLTRRIDASVIERVGIDPKDWTENPRPRIYVPRTAPEQFDYYTRAAAQRPEINLDVQYLPAELSPENIRKLNDKPGLLAVEMESYIVDPKTGATDLRGLPFVVPGGRFNELYGWDSYMESLGLLVCNRVDLAKAMVEHFCFCIEHYGMILNASRSYFLCRSQPPFLTDMAINVYKRIEKEEGAIKFLRRAILAAIKEYKTIWTAQPRYDPVTGLSRYRPVPLGIPQETEPDHFAHLLAPYCEKYNLSLADFISSYNDGKVYEPDLDSYFLHDCAVRESGHDTSYRLEGVCADLATIDLNSLLYKFEIDIAQCIQDYLGGSLEIPAGGDGPPSIEKAETWTLASQRRLEAINKYLWSEEQGVYLDYNTASKKQTIHPAAPTFWPLWAGIATAEQAAKLVTFGLPRFEAFGGITSGPSECRAANEPPRQWDYPSGWAPHQILLWRGLVRYGFKVEAQRLAYKWLYTMTKAFADYNGVVVEKYDVTNSKAPQRVNAEYGNQGLDFRGMNREGFGWVNASYVCGLEIVDESMKRAIGALVPYDQYRKAHDKKLG